MKIVKKSGILLIGSLVLNACSGDFLNLSDTDLSISPFLNVPLGTVNITMSNVVPDTGLVSQDSNRFFISYKLDSALTVFADSLIPELPAIQFSDSADLANVVLPNFSQGADLTLGEFGPTANLNGGIFIFPPLGPVYGGSQALQGNSPVCTAVLSQGTVTLTVTNSWPIPVQLSLALVNNSNGVTVTNFVFPQILPGSSSAQTKSLVGKTFSNNMSFEIINVQSPGSGGSPVPYSSSDEISFVLQSNSIEVSSGSVVFPQSQLFTSSEFYDFGLANGIRLKKIFVKRAVIRYQVSMPIDGIVETDITIPFSDNFGAPFGFTINSTPGLPSIGRAVLQNVAIDLSKSPGNPYNRLPFEIESYIMSASNCVGFDANDELNFQFELDSIELDAVEGQFGSYDIALEQQINLDDLGAGFEFDEMIFYGPKLSIDFKNSIGIPVFVDLELKSTNSYGTHSVSESNFPVPYPQENVFPLLREGSLVVQPDTAVPFLVFPNQDLEVAVTAKIRSTGNPNPPHFVQLGEDLNVGIGVVQESRFSISNLRFRDTVGVSGPDSSVLANLLEAFWGVSYQNQLPFDVVLELIALDSGGSVLFAKSLDLVGLEGETKLELNQVEILSLATLEELVWNVRFDSSASGDKVLNATDALILNLSLGGRYRIEVL
jgi:hypothetical protein